MVVSPCTRTSSALNKGPITARELAGMDVDVVKGIGDKKKDALETFGISSVLDLIETYPRRWVDRTREALVAALRPDVLQLHGREHPDRLSAIFKEFGIPIMKAIGVA